MKIVMIGVVLSLVACRAWTKPLPPRGATDYRLYDGGLDPSEFYWIGEPRWEEEERVELEDGDHVYERKSANLPIVRVQRRRGRRFGAGCLWASQRALQVRNKDADGYTREATVDSDYIETQHGIGCDDLKAWIDDYHAVPGPILEIARGASTKVVGSDGRAYVLGGGSETIERVELAE